MEKIDNLKRQRIEKLERIKELGVNPYPTKFERTGFVKDFKADFKDKKNVKVAGRIVSLRKMGKAAFFNVKDFSGRMQVYIQREAVGEENFKLFKCLDIGDFIGVSGYLFLTKTAEKSIHAEEIKVLTKSLKALPIVKEKETLTGEKIKYDEVSDIEFRYRQRYVDLNINEGSLEVFKKRSKIISFLRNYLLNVDFLEVETPVMQPLCGGAAAKPFETYHNALSMPLFLRIAPELYLKRIMVGGADRVFEIGRNFRNEGISTKHNPEFTMLELYQAYADYYDMMDLTESLITDCLKVINHGETLLNYGEHEIDFSNWTRIKMEDLFVKYAGIDFSLINNLAGIKKEADRLGVKYEDDTTSQKIYDHIFEEKIEHRLINPTIVYDFPKAWSPLAKENFHNPLIAERFEVFIAAREIGNAYSELNNPLDQKLRMEEQAQAKELGDDEACDVDYDYIRALEYGMAPCGGLGIGVDRLVMLFTNSQSIRDVILFPHLKKE
ncbi:MAG: lysine--tRNA ligase [bacterium]|nr:lysine--tRNA ligase [bacterium]